MMSFFNKDKNMFGPKEDNKSRNFRYLDDLVHSGVKEILLDSDIVLSRDEKSQYLNGIELDVDDLVIDGNGYAIDAQGLTRIFHCTGKNVFIKNIILKNGFTEKNGGAIYNRGELTITESTLSENTAQLYGGAIHNMSRLTITESILNENTAEYGGAIHNLKGEITITESTLTENTAQRKSGAIHNYDGELTITESALTKNTAQREGGAIYNSWEGELIITESILNENTAEYGGAILNLGRLTITESTLAENTAQYEGGAIHNGSRLTITESTLAENTAVEGGAIYSYHNNINIDNCTLVNNLQSSFSFVENNNKFDIEWNDEFISSDDITIYLDNEIDGEYHLADNQIEWNKTLAKGSHEIILELNDNRIIMNFTYSPKIITTNVNNYAELIDSINKAKYIITPQYIIDLNKGDYNATNTIVWNPVSNSNLIINGNEITLNGQNTCQFIRIGTNSKLALNNIILTNFTAEYGGAIYNRGELTITESTLHENTAEYGGAICNYSELTITDSTITENTAQWDGGAIYNSLEGELTITDSTLSENTAKRGGAIHNWDGSVLTITDSTLSENTVKRG